MAISVLLRQSRVRTRGVRKGTKRQEMPGNARHRVPAPTPAVPPFPFKMCATNRRLRRLALVSRRRMQRRKRPEHQRRDAAQRDRLLDLQPMPGDWESSVASTSRAKRGRVVASVWNSDNAARRRLLQSAGRRSPATKARVPAHGCRGATASDALRQLGRVVPRRLREARSRRARRQSRRCLRSSPGRLFRWKKAPASVPCTAKSVSSDTRHGERYRRAADPQLVGFMPNGVTRRIGRAELCHTSRCSRPSSRVDIAARDRRARA